MIYKRGKTYWYKFMWNGELVRESTKQGNDRVARNICLLYTSLPGWKRRSGLP